MTQTQEQTTTQPVLVRSEELLDHLGQNIGSFAALTRQRIQQTVTRVAPTRGEPTAQPKTAQNGQANQPQSKIASGPIPPAEMQRAERLVDDMGQRLADLTSPVGLQIRKMAAYAREGAEDIWAEAQNIRSTRGKH